MFFKQGKINGNQVNSCADYCAAHGLTCVYSYALWEGQPCSTFQEEAKMAESSGMRYSTSHSYTSCDVPEDVTNGLTNGIGCVCGKF